MNEGGREGVREEGVREGGSDRQLEIESLMHMNVCM